MRQSALDHQAIHMLLPDYALGALPDAELDALSEHLATCAECQAELAWMIDIGARLDLAAGPDPAVRDRVLSAAATAGASSASASTPPPTTAPGQPIPFAAGQRPPRTIPRWVVAVAAVLLLALGWWNVQLQAELRRLAPASAMLTAAAIIPLTDTQLDPMPSGTLFVSADGDHGVLAAANLPGLPAGQSYQVWLFDQAGDRQPVGDFTLNDAGVAQLTISPPQPILAYSAIAVSAGISGETAPTGPLALGAWLAPPQSSTPAP